MNPLRLAFLVSAVVSITVSVSAVDAIDLKLATILPSGTSGHQRLMEMRDAWHKAAPGAVKLTIYPGSGDGEIQLVKKMRARQLHAVLVSAVGLAQIDRSITSLQVMPMMFRDWREVDHVREKVRGELEARLRDKGFEVLFWADAGWVRYFSKEPALYPAELKRMKMFVWTGDPQQLTILRNLGYQPVGLETEQILPALSTGMISVVPVPPFLANALQYNRYAGHMIDVNWAPIVGAAVVRRDTWEKVPAALRSELTKLAEITGERIRARNREEDDDAIAAMRKRGLTVHSASPDALAEWRKVAEESYPQIRGTLVPAELFDRVQTLVTEYRAAHGISAR